jgi:hypothetical protein
MKRHRFQKRPYFAEARPAPEDVSSIMRIFHQGSPSLVSRFVIPTSVLAVTRSHVLARGAAGQEAALIWTGMVSGNIAVATTAVLFTGSSSFGGGVRISEHTTGLLYDHCQRRGLTLLGQVHSHPGRAFHSQPDAELPHSPEKGFLSVVIPNFGDCPFDDFATWAVFEQESYEKWREWAPSEKRSRLQILDSEIPIG